MDPTTIFSNSNADYQSLIELYYKVRESEVYYRSLRHAVTRRDNYHKIIDDIESFVSLIALDDQKLDYLQQYFFTNTKPTIQRNEEIILQAKIVNLEGYNLLEIEDKLSFDILRDKYRQAAIKFHPDIGGSEKRMTIINIARQQFHELLSMKELNQERSSVNSSRLFSLSLLQLILSIYYDIFDISSLYAWLTYLIDNKDTILLQDNEYNSINSFVIFLCDATERIMASNYPADSRKMLGYIKSIILDKSSNIPEYMSKRLQICQNNISNNIHHRVILNHVIQVENAYKYGIIDKIRYNEYKNKFVTIINKNDNTNELLIEYVHFVGFIKLVVDKNIVHKPLVKNIIPENYDYHGDLSTINDDQTSEYYKTFYIEPTIELLRKYTYIRLDRILRTIIHYFNVDLNFDVYIRELELLKEIQNKRTVLPLFIDNILSFIKMLQKHSFETNQERLEILRNLDKLDIEEKESDGFFAIIRHLTFNKISPSDYVEFAMEDIGILKQAFKTRVYKPKSFLSSDKYNSVEYKNDSIIIKELEQARHKIWDLYNNNSVDDFEKSQLIENLLKEMFDIENKITYKEELQIGYWINELTISYVKQKKFGEAFYWLQKFIFLPNQWKLRSNNSELEAINKRFDRCKKALKHI